MQQSAHQSLPEVQSVIEIAQELFCVDQADIQEEVMEGNTVRFWGDAFNYELEEMYNDLSDLERKRDFYCFIPNAGDNGATNAITVESIKLEDGQTMFVVYDIYQPTRNNDESWDCSGELSLTLTTPETHDALLMETIEKVKKDSEVTAVSLANSLIEAVASDADAKARIFTGLLAEMFQNVGYVYRRNQNEVVPVGSLAVFHAIVEADRKLSSSLSKSWAGAMLGSLLLDHPLVESFIVNFSTSDEYDDNNYFTAKNAAISDVVFVNNVPSVKLEDEGDVEVDAFGYADLMQEGIEDCEYDLYDGFAVDPDGTDEFMVQVRRSDVKALLDFDVVDGVAVGKEIARTLECVQ